MDKLSFPTLDQERWTTSGKEPEGRAENALAAVDFLAVTSPPAIDTDTVSEQGIGTQISSIMEERLWTVHAEDTIEKVEEILSEHGLSSVPVMGSDGAIVGIIGTQELALFHSEKKNPKAVRAWEISRCRIFEVSPTDCIEDVAKLMAENKIDNIAVTQHGGLQGVVSVQDVFLEILKENADQASAAKVEGDA